MNKKEKTYNKEKIYNRKKLIKKGFIYITSMAAALLVITGIGVTNARADREDGDIIELTFFDNETITSPGDLVLETPTKANINNGENTNKQTTGKPGITNNIKKIKAKIITAKRVKANKTKAKVKIQKVNKITGYQVKYALNKKMKKYKIRTGSKRQITLKNLKVKKKYYVKARVYVKNGKGNVYGKWSKRKVIK